jgi:transcriptional regulator with XRE-family HTH domain
MSDRETLAEPFERMRWARRQAGFDHAKDAAAALGISDVTYRSYERGPEHAGRWPKLPQLQRIAARFGVSWLWLHDGQGDPLDGVAPDEDLRRLIESAKVVDISKRADAINAAVSVLESFRRKRG